MAKRLDGVISPPFDFGPTGYAPDGPEDGTIDPVYDAFGPYVKSILRNFLGMGFGRVYVMITHQGMEAPLALAFKKAAAELSWRHSSSWPHVRNW